MSELEDENQLLTLVWSRRTGGGPEVYDLRAYGTGSEHLLTGIAYRSHAGGARANVSFQGAHFVTTRGKVRDAVRLMNAKLRKHFRERDIAVSISDEPMPAPRQPFTTRLGEHGAVADVPRREAPSDVLINRILTHPMSTSTRRVSLLTGCKHALGVG